jgi:hypothetical protein
VGAGAPVLHVVAEGAAQSKEVAIDLPADAVTLDSAGRRLLLASSLQGRISILAPSTGGVTQRMDLPQVSRVAVDPEGREIYSLSARRGTITWLNRILGTVVRELPAGKEPWDLVVLP